MVDPNGDWIEIIRLDHNLGKVHDTEIVKFQITKFDENGINPKQEPEILEISGKNFQEGRAW